MIFHSIERLGAPFHSVSEVGLVIPRAGEAVVANPEFKILFFLQGNCTQSIEGFGSRPVKPGDIYVIPRPCIQRYSGDGLTRAEYQVHALKISLSFPPLDDPAATGGRAGAPDPEGDLEDFVRHYFVDIHYLPSAQTPAMREIMRGIRREAELHAPGMRHRVRALCTNLTVHVARQLYTPSPSVANAEGFGTLVNQAKEFILRNFQKPLTLGEIAWHVRKSDEHLARIFRRVTGQTVFDYLRAVRIENAKTMLIDSNLTIGEIAERTGFSSLALFSRNFSAYVGQCASAYRDARAQYTYWDTPRLT